MLIGSDGHVQLGDLGLCVFMSSKATAMERRHTFGGATAALKSSVRGRAGTPGSWFSVLFSVVLPVMIMMRMAGFWAPEMLGNDDSGKPAEYTSVADFYSLGCFMYNLLCGRCEYPSLGVVLLPWIA